MGATTKTIRESLERLCAGVPLIGAMSAAGKAEIGGALRRNCRSDEHVRSVVQAFLETVSDWRNPIAEVSRLARELRPTDHPPDGCARCEIAPGIWAAFVTVERNGEFGSGRCTCPRGEWLKRRGA